mmetsp:Transcript_40409/g.91781  ORF Transcript_40409/g.91781 Transcript_40409/m.91781 type:complete len:274 (-) Transcript_40409:1086-1907(-)
MDSMSRKIGFTRTADKSSRERMASALWRRAPPAGTPSLSAAMMMFSQFHSSNCSAFSMATSMIRSTKGASMIDKRPKPHARWPNSCPLKSSSMGKACAERTFINSSSLKFKTAHAHAMMDMLCDLSLSGCFFIWAATASMSGRSLNFREAHDQTTMAKFCMLNSSIRSTVNLAMASKSSRLSTSSLAKDQMVLLTSWAAYASNFTRVLCAAASMKMRSLYCTVAKPHSMPLRLMGRKLPMTASPLPMQASKSSLSVSFSDANPQTTRLKEPGS